MGHAATSYMLETVYQGDDTDIDVVGIMTNKRLARGLSLREQCSIVTDVVVDRSTFNEQHERYPAEKVEPIEKARDGLYVKKASLRRVSDWSDEDKKELNRLTKQRGHILETWRHAEYKAQSHEQA